MSSQSITQEAMAKLEAAMAQLQRTLQKLGEQIIS
jgi:hypothetical protein